MIPLPWPPSAGIITERLPSHAWVHLFSPQLIFSRLLPINHCSEEQKLQLFYPDLHHSGCLGLRMKLYFIDQMWVNMNSRFLHLFSNHIIILNYTHSITLNVLNVSGFLCFSNVRIYTISLNIPHKCLQYSPLRYSGHMKDRPLFPFKFFIISVLLAWSLHLETELRSPGLSLTEPSHQPPFKFVSLVLWDKVLHFCVGWLWT